jgi:hypothetical protein
MYVKVFASILTSTLWALDDATRIVWITLLALADKEGFVRASPSGLARLANVDEDKVRVAIEKLESPDKDSGSQGFDGRRLERVEGGFLLLNYKKYRDLKDAETRREQVRDAVRRHRAKKSDVIIGDPEKAQAEAAAEITLLPAKKRAQRPVDPYFEELLSLYPKRAGSNPKEAAQKALHARIAEGVSLEVLEAGMARYLAFCQNTGKIGTEYVMQAVRFFGPSKPYEESWDAPAAAPTKKDAGIADAVAEASDLSGFVA